MDCWGFEAACRISFKCIFEMDAWHSNYFSEEYSLSGEVSSPAEWPLQSKGNPVMQKMRCL